MVALVLKNLPSYVVYSPIAFKMFIFLYVFGPEMLLFIKYYPFTLEFRDELSCDTALVLKAGPLGEDNIFFGSINIYSSPACRSKNLKIYYGVILFSGSKAKLFSRKSSENLLIFGGKRVRIELDFSIFLRSD
jgi:hypothetical protein